jgi:hypothetical protein
VIFIVRTDAMPDLAPLGLVARMVRRTPVMVGGGDGSIDIFCDGDPDVAKSAGWSVLAVHDGWYADDTGGGMAIWGQGVFWEVRDTPFTVRQACGPEAWPAKVDHDQEAAVNVRQAIFRG